MDHLQTRLQTRQQAFNVKCSLVAQFWDPSTIKTVFRT